MLKEIFTKATRETDVKPGRVLHEALRHAKRWHATSTKTSPGRSCGEATFSPNFTVEFSVKTPGLEARAEETGGDVYAGGKPVPLDKRARRLKRLVVKTWRIDSWSNTHTEKDRTLCR
jgi:ribosome-associated translation inhibitor RaiA